MRTANSASCQSEPTVGGALLLRAYDWLLRRRLVREPQWGQPGLWQRLLRIRLLSALALSLPALVLCVWYTLVALSGHFIHQRAVKVREPLTLELFQLHLHDRLVRDWQRLVMPEPQRKSPLPTYGLAVSADKLDELERHPPVNEGPSFYVDGMLIRNGQAHQVQVRYRGTKASMAHDPQQSWKVRVKEGRSVEGFATFNFINTVETVPFEEDIVLDIAREQGLLTPEYFPFRLLLNKSYLGVYFFEAQPDEGLLRRERRAPGSIYSGGEAPTDVKTGVSTLFRSADHFTKVAQGIHQQLGERDELESLIYSINSGTTREFIEYAPRHLALDKFATFDALDVVFGCSQHDFSDNHKLYYDPYRERFEPIAWNFRGCKHEHEFNRTENPLLLRLKTLPGYLALRNRLVYGLLRGAAAPESLRERTRHLLDRLQADQIRDPFWDAHQLLPAMNAYYAQLKRPLNRGLQELTAETRLYELSKRNRYLTEALDRFDIEVTVTHPARPAQSRSDRTPAGQVSALDVRAGGESGYRVVRVEPVWAGDCKPNSWRVFADTTMDGKLDRERDRLLGVVSDSARSTPTDLELYPGVRFDARSVSPRRGAVRAVSEARRYRLYVESDACELQGAFLELRNLATEQSLRLAAPAAGVGAATLAPTTCSDRYQEAAGFRSAHAWCFLQAKSEAVNLGPGVVDVIETRVFEAHQSVSIAPGTTLRMATGASMIFKGRVVAIGTQQKPIRFEPIANSWGGILIQGPGTRDSRLAYVTLAHGTRLADSSVLTPGTLNLQDTAGIVVEHCRLFGTRQADAGLQVADVSELELNDFEVATIAGDGVILRYSSARVSGLSVLGVARDAVVIDGADVELARSQLIGAKGNALSAGRAARVVLQDSILTGSRRGLFAHEAATVELNDVLVYKDVIGVELDTSDDGFPGKAKIKGEGLHVVGCESSFSVAGGKKRKQQEKISERLSALDLVRLRSEVLRINTWDGLDGVLAAQLKLSEGRQ